MALRFSRFRRWAEPILSVAVAIALLSAFVVWISDRGERKAAAPEPVATAPAAPAAQNISLDGMTFEQSQPERSFRLRGTVSNNGATPLEYFRLSVTLEDCPQDACAKIGDDSALVLARVPVGQARPFETFLTFPSREGESLTTPKWTYQVLEVRGAASR